MSGITLEQARTIIAAALAKGEAEKMLPLSVAVLDAGGHTTAFERQDGASAMRFKIAHGKAYGAIAMGLGTRALYERAQKQAYFLDAMNALAGGALVPVPGGVLAKNANGRVVAAIGISGDTSDNDEACAKAGIEAAGMAAETG
jgi:uncharacterized protein GlcG (DUF336 family)